MATRIWLKCLSTTDKNKMSMNFPEIYSATGMMELIQKVGFLKAVGIGRYGNGRARLCMERKHISVTSEKESSDI